YACSPCGTTTFNASAAPRWNRQMSTLPRAFPPRPAAPLLSSMPNTLRLRNDGLNPIVTSAIAPDFMNTRRFIVCHPPRAKRAGDLLVNALALPVFKLRDSTADPRRCAAEDDTQISVSETPAP